jgi:hypothetical protein
MKIKELAAPAVRQTLAGASFRRAAFPFLWGYEFIVRQMIVNIGKTALTYFKYFEGKERPARMVRWRAGDARSDHVLIRGSFVVTSRKERRRLTPIRVKLTNPMEAEW